jgi:hypothetical protein
MDGKEAYGLAARVRCAYGPGPGLGPLSLPKCTWLPWPGNIARGAYEGYAGMAPASPACSACCGLLALGTITPPQYAGTAVGDDWLLGLTAYAIGSGGRPSPAGPVRKGESGLGARDAECERLLTEPGGAPMAAAKAG